MVLDKPAVTFCDSPRLLNGDVSAQVQTPGSEPDEKLLNHLALDFDESESLMEKHEVLKVSPIEVNYMPLSSTVQPTAGHILQYCKKKVDSFRVSVGANVCVYKVGLTTNPLRRFTGYVQLNYTRMSLLHATHCQGTAEMLEASLIDNHMGRTGFRNQRTGGENCMSGASAYYVYVVGARADRPKPIG